MKANNGALCGTGDAYGCDEAKVHGTCQTPPCRFHSSGWVVKGEGSTTISKAHPAVAKIVVLEGKRGSSSDEELPSEQDGQDVGTRLQRSGGWVGGGFGDDGLFETDCQGTI